MIRAMRTRHFAVHRVPNKMSPVVPGSYAPSSRDGRTGSSCRKESLMSTANTPPSSSLPQLPLPQLIEQRLDAIDQALLGLLPRADRRAAVTHVETQIRDAVAACPAIAANLPTPAQGLNPPHSASSPLAGG